MKTPQLIKATLTSLAIILLTTAGSVAAQPQSPAEKVAARKAARDLANKAAEEERIKRAAQTAKAINQGKSPVDAVLEGMQPVVVEGHNLTRSIAEQVVKGVAVPQATHIAKVAKRAEVLSTKGYGFSASDYYTLAEEIEKGKTLEEVIRAKAPPVFCTGVAIQGEVVARMIAGNTSFDAALEQVSIETHLNKLRQYNNGPVNFGLSEAILLNVAQRVTRKQSPNYQVALAEALGPIMYPFEGVQTDITQLVAAQVFQNDLPGTSLAAATEAVKCEHVRQVYQQKNLGLDNLELGMISRGIVIKNQTALQAITVSLALALHMHRGQSLTDRLAQAIAANTTKAAALAAIKMDIDQGYFRGLNIALTPKQIADAATFTAQGLGDTEALAKALPAVRCGVKDITLLVATRMIGSGENYAVASTNAKIAQHTAFLQLNTVGFDQPTITRIATQLGQSDALSYADALKDHLQPVNYEGTDLRRLVAIEMLKKASFAEARKQVWIVTAIEDISLKHPAIRDLARDFAQRMFEGNLTKAQVLEAHVKTLPYFARTLDKAAEVAQLVLSGVQRIESGWRSVCVIPKAKELTAKYPNFGEEVVSFMAEEIVKIGATEVNSLTSYLTHRKISGKYCKHLNVIANFMMTDKLSWKDAAQKADMQVVRQQLTKNAGWAGLQADTLESLIKLCLSYDSIEKAEEAFVLSICKKIPGSHQKAFLRLARFARVPLQQFEGEYLTNTVIPEQMREQYPNLTDARIIKSIAECLVRDDKVKVRIDGQIVVGLDAGTLKEALQAHYPFAAEGINGAAIAPMAEKMAVKLLANSRLTPVDAFVEARVDERAVVLKTDPDHLGEVGRRELANIMIRKKIDDLREAIKLVFQARHYSDAGELAQMIDAVLVQRRSFDQAEELFGFRKLMVDDPRLKEDEARKIALLMRRGLDKAAAYKQFMAEKFAFPEVKVADLCHDMYFADKNEDMVVAAEKATWVANTAGTLKRKSFYPFEITTEAALWKIAGEALSKHHRDTTKAMGAYLMKEIGAPFHLSPEAYHLLKVEYFTSMANALLTINGMTLGEYTAHALNNFEVFQGTLLRCCAVYFSNNAGGLTEDRQIQYWKTIFGECDVSLPTLTAIMMYKFGERDLENQNQINFEHLKGALLKAVPVFLQYINPDDAKAKMACLGRGNPDQRVVEREAVAPLCAGFYNAVASRMIQGKHSYDQTIPVLKGAVDTKVQAIKAGFRYLDVIDTSYLQEIAEAEIYAQMDRKVKAIYRFLNGNLARHAGSLTILSKNPNDAGFDADERKSLLEYVAEVLSNRAGERLEDVCAIVRKQYLDYLQKLTAKVAGRITFLTPAHCETLLWDTRILRTNPTEALAHILAGIPGCTIPTFMLSGDYLGRAFNIAPLPMKRRVASMKIAEALKLDLNNDKPPRTFEEAIHSELVLFFEQSLMRGGLRLPKPLLQPLSARLAKVVLDARDLPLDQQLRRVKDEKHASVKEILERKVLVRPEMVYLDAVTQKMMTSPSSILCALLEARIDDLMSAPDKKGLTPDMFAFWVKLVAFKERGILQDDVSTFSPQLAGLLAKALAIKARVEGGEGRVEPVEAFEGREGEEGFDPNDLPDLELDLAIYHLAKKNAPRVQRELLLEGAQPLQECVCLDNLKLLELQPAHFACPNFELPRDLVHVARSKSVRGTKDVLLLDPGTIATLYRRDNNILPVFTLDREREIARLSANQKATLRAQWDTFLRAMNSVPAEEWRQEAALKPWNKHPNNPRFLTSILDSLRAFDDTQRGKSIRINIQTLQFDPWYTPTHYDTLPVVDVVEYEGLRNMIFARVRTHMAQRGIPNNPYRGHLWRIGRFFAWGDTRDKYEGEGENKYLANGFFKEDPFKGSDLVLWRKRVKLVCENLIFKGAPTDEQVFDRIAYLYDDQMSACDNAAKDALLKLEQQIPALQKLTLFNKVAYSLNIWKVDMIDVLVSRNLQARLGLETEYGRFMRVACRRTLSVQTLEDSISHHDYLNIQAGAWEINHGHSLSIRPFVLEYLTAYQTEICGLIKQNIDYRVRPDVATSIIYLEDILEWAKLHPKYCNTLEGDLLKELTVDGVGKEVKDVVVRRLLSHAGYIDWEDRER